MSVSYLVAFACSFLFSIIGTPLVIQLCKTYQLYDLPNARKMHHTAVPRLGGSLFLPSLGIGAVCALAVSYGGFNSNIEITISTILMIVGAFMIFLTGIFDDLKGIKASYKFIIQTIAAFIFPFCNLSVSNMHGFFGIYEMNFVVSYFVTAFIILLIVNAINLIDGIDGLSSSLAMLMFGAFAYLYFSLGHHLFCLMSISMVGALIAFFIYNMFGKVGKQKIFMGDSGSLFLGYVLSYLAIKYQMSNELNGFPYREESFLISLTLLFVPCIDVIRVAIFRKIKGKSMFEPDKNHLHHVLMKKGLNMHQTLICIIGLFFAICTVNYFLNLLQLQITFIVLIDVILYSFLLVMGKEKKS